MVFQVGDRVVAESESTERPGRRGTVREVLREDPPRYRIEWDDGHESSYTPAAGALYAEPRRAGAAT
jgi:Domain of unknown function (DUF1918)